MDFPLGSVLGPVRFNILCTDPNGRLENRLIKFRGKCSLVHCNYFGRQIQNGHDELEIRMEKWHLHKLKNVFPSSAIERYICRKVGNTAVEGEIQIGMDLEIIAD